MSRDIRSFFYKSPKGAPAPVRPRKTAVISDEEKEASPSKRLASGPKKPRDRSQTKKRTIIYSDDEEDERQSGRVNNCKKPKVAEDAGSKEVEISVAEFYSNKPIKRINAPKVVKKVIEEPKKPEVITIDFNDDDNFEETLIQLDTSKIEDEYMSTLNNDKSPFFDGKPSAKKSDNAASSSASDEKAKVDLSRLKGKDKSESESGEDSAKKNDKAERNGSTSKNESENEKKHVSKKEKNYQSEKEKKQNNEKEKRHDSEKEKKHENDKDKKKKNQPHSKLEVVHESKSPKPKPKANDNHVDYNEIIQEKIEKKKNHALQYQHYLNRGGARNPGSKEVPKGADNCFANMSFIITGVLDSLEREEAEGIIKQYGGKVVHSVSKKLNYMIVGDEPGPSKMTKAESLSIKIISEDDFLDLLRTSSDNAESNDTSNKRKRENSVSADQKKSPEKKKNKQESPSENKHESPKEIKTSKEDTSTQNHKSPVKSPTAEELPIKKSVSPVKPVQPALPVKKEKTKPSPPKLENKDVKTDRAPINDVTNKILDGVDHTTALVEKYRPKDMKQIIGQAGDKSNAKKLHFWLKNWHKNHAKNAVKPPYNPRDNTGIIMKAALLSGPPGIGKTTTAYVVCADLGFEVIEFNASDTRSKKLLQEEIAGILKNRTVRSFLNAPNEKRAPSKHVLLMDEVDGMAGNEDRGGMQELIAFIKSTEIPIICICNDIHSQKIKSLLNYTFDLRFQKPRLEQIRAAMMSICFKEGIKISPEEISRIILSTNQDIRQVINHVAILSAKTQSPTATHSNAEKYKNLKLGPWEVIRKVFSAEEHKHMSIHDKSDLFFNDYSIAPLFVEENYLIVTPSGPRTEIYDKLARCADSLAIGDIIENTIRSKQNWGLLPVQACFSSVIPGSVMSGFINSQINFPSWLGRNSKAKKCDRLLQDITVHARTVTGASKEAVNLDYLKMMCDSVLRPLVVEGTEGVDKAVAAMNHYHLARDDLDGLLELTKWPHTRDLMQSVDTKTKTAFTKAYNKSALSTTVGMTKKKSGRDDAMDGLMGEDEEAGAIDDEDEDEDKIENDKMIKAKTSKATKAKGSGAAAAPKAKKPSTRGRKKK